ncbi:S-layer homology domain-containing protein [Paenibacillus sp. KR2-11]|uniref:S-layer homology domain-containing protein n=1 Tax=Paenibacillus sp. KR2-11 TaxID=3385500 RepID=UPI0038FC6D85
MEARSTDTAGNISDITSYQVTNIDGDAPTGITISADTDEPTNGPVTVTISFPADAVVQEYRIDDGPWIPYTGPVELSGNGTLEARGTDALGNQSPTESYTVSNIDQTPPADATFTADNTAPTSSSVTVTVNYPADGAIREIRVNGGAWAAYTGPVVFAANGTLDARSMDTAGNMSGIASYQVTNIRSTGGGGGSGGMGTSAGGIIGNACKITRVLNRIVIDGCLDEANQTIEARLGPSILDSSLDELLNSGDKEIIFDVVLPARIYLIHIPQSLVRNYQARNIQFIFEYVDQTYEMPSGSTPFEQVSVSTASSEASVTYQVNSLTGPSERELSALESAQGFHIRDNFYQFTVYTMSGGKKIIPSIQKGQFITRKLYPASRDIEKVTGLVYKSDGSVNYAPYRRSLKENEMELLLLRNGGIYGVAEYVKGFLDSKGHWGQQSVERLASKMIVFGRNDKDFIPDDQVTRAEFAALLLRTLDLPLDAEEPPYFQDVNSSHWYYEVVQSAKLHGIIEGYDDHTFAPGKPINREEMTAMMVRLLNREFPYLDLGSLPSAQDEQSLYKFTDYVEISAFFREQARMMANIGLIEGYPDHSFKPKGNATRAESVVIIQRFLEFVEFIR